MAVRQIAVAAMTALAIGLSAAGQAVAGEVDVVDVTITAERDGSYRFDVTLRHADGGWDHYADRWEVLSADGKSVLATRILAHPHVEEQPFTRSLGGVDLPAGLDAVRVRGHDKRHGYIGREMTVSVPR